MTDRMIEVRRVHSRPLLLDPSATFLPDRDTILQATIGDYVAGFEIMRPMWYAHRLQIDPALGPSRRAAVARALVHYGLGMTDHVTIPPSVPLGLLLHCPAPNDPIAGLLDGPSVTLDSGGVLRYDNFRR